MTASPVRKKAAQRTRGARKAAQAEASALAEVAVLSERIDRITDVLSELTAQNALLRSRDAADHPVEIRRRGQIESEEQYQGSGGAAEFRDTRQHGDTPDLLRVAGGEVLDDPWLKEKAEYEAFMAQELIVDILTTNEKNAQQIFEISVNGNTFTFRRGQRYEKVPRYIVEGLARCKPQTYESEEYIDVKDGQRKIRYNASRGVRYPFQVTYDPLGKTGSDWLQAVLAQP